MQEVVLDRRPQRQRHDVEAHRNAELNGRGDPDRVADGGVVSEVLGDCPGEKLLDRPL